MNEPEHHLESALRNRFDRIGAAIADLRISSQRILTVGQRREDAFAAQLYTNRLASVLVGINHLKDDVKRLAKHRALPPSDVESFIKSSLPILLCSKAAETYKHGTGGRAGNNTVIKELVVIKTPKDTQPSDASQTAIAGALIVDEQGDSFDANIVIRNALGAWVHFLELRFGLAYADWLATAAPAPTGPKVLIEPGVKCEVPLGSVVTIPLPDEVRQQIKDESKARKQFK